MAPTATTYSHDDPLAWVLKPPKGETDAERTARLKQEAEARQISDRIDEELRIEREHLKKTKTLGNSVTLLLLGQSESGKSTLARQFQLLYSSDGLDVERSSWRAIVYLNIVRTIRAILYAFDEEDDDDDESNPRLLNRRSDSGDSWRHQLANLKLRLRPLVAMEEKLVENITSGASYRNAPLVRSGWQISLRSKWKNGSQQKESRPSASYEQDDIEATARVLAHCNADVTELWTHPAVKSLITKRKLRLEDSASFFLEQIDRIASPAYLPSDNDILRARIQTLGIAEYMFDVAVGGKKVRWNLYDVGGARGQRHTWIPYFEDANAIIFLAPISAFDQFLEEDHRVNRIDDSLQLFSAICSNPLLKNVHLVLFLNKADVLQQKLNAGVSVRRYIKSFGDRPNEFKEVSAYFRAHFEQVHRKNNADRKRVLYTHMTSVVDTKATQSIINNVRDSIFRGFLKDSALV